VKRILLIVDDIPAVARSLSRFFRRDFDQVLMAHTVEQAERLLGDSEAMPTHLVCDHYLGDDGQLGARLVPGWRRAHPHLRVAVLLTGSELGDLLVRDQGVDAVFRKPVDVDVLRKFLLAGDCPPASPL
jgi:ActR/RegA family two-component response regulator